MRLTDKIKEALGLSMLFSAVSLAIAFVVLSIRKRSVLAALAALAAAQGVAGLWLLVDGKSKRGLHDDWVQRPAAQEDVELFSDEECEQADAHIRQVLCGKREGREPVRILREIPRDEEATEADFQ